MGQARWRYFYRRLYHRRPKAFHARSPVSFVIRLIIEISNGVAQVSPTYRADGLSHYIDAVIKTAVTALDLARTDVDLRLR
jgi:hypothetical protein